MRRQRDRSFPGSFLVPTSGCTAKGSFLPSLSFVIKPFLPCPSLRLHNLQLARREKKQEVVGEQMFPFFAWLHPGVPPVATQVDLVTSDSVLATASAGARWPFYVSVSRPCCPVLCLEVSGTISRTCQQYDFAKQHTQNTALLLTGIKVTVNNVPMESRANSKFYQ